MRIVFTEYEGGLLQQAILLEVASEDALKDWLAKLPLGDDILKLNTAIKFPTALKKNKRIAGVLSDCLIFHSIYMPNLIRYDSKNGLEHKYMKQGNFGMPCLDFVQKWKAAAHHRPTHQRI